MVLATQNPIEQEGTYPLPEAQMDRFLVRLGLGYPAAQVEVDILKSHALSEPLDRIGEKDAFLARLKARFEALRAEGTFSEWQ